MPVARYDAQSLHRAVGDAFELIETLRHEHRTPWGSEQHFQFSLTRFRSLGSLDLDVQGALGPPMSNRRPSGAISTEPRAIARMARRERAQYAPPSGAAPQSVINGGPGRSAAAVELRLDATRKETHMAMRPDPTFHASPKLAMEAPPEEFAYTALLSPDFSKPDALAVIDVKPGSPTYSQIVHTVTMPSKGDEFHHFGWNACSSSLSPLAGHAFLERRYLIIPGIRSSRIYVVDTKPHPTQAKVEIRSSSREEVFRKTGYSRPHTSHCGPEGIYVGALGGGGKDGTEGPPGVFIMDCETFDILGRLGDRSRASKAAL